MASTSNSNALSALQKQTAATASELARQERPRKRLKIDIRDMIEVVVGSGPQQEAYSVHANVLTETSLFFRAACSSRWREKTLKRIHLPDHSPITFQNYLYWRCRGKVELSEEGEERLPAYNGEPQDVQIVGVHWARSVQCYILGDFLGDYRFCNALVATWTNLWSTTLIIPESKDIEYVFQSQPESSKLRLWLTHIIAYNIAIEEFDTIFRECSPDVSIAVATVLREERASHVSPYARPKCTYHVHDEDNPECNTW